MTSIAISNVIFQNGKQLLVNFQALFFITLENSVNYGKFSLYLKLYQTYFEFTSKMELKSGLR